MSIRSAFSALIGPGAAYAGPDQGIDFTGKAPVYTLGDAQITRVDRNSSWPGEHAVVVYKLKSGPGAGRYIYTAEDFAPAANVQVGATLPKGALLGTATGSWLAPGIETGWATPEGLPVAPLANPGGKPGHSAAALAIGDNFRQFVAAISGSGPVPSAPVAPATSPPASSAPPAPTSAGGAQDVGFWGDVLKGAATGNPFSLVTTWLGGVGSTLQLTKDVIAHPETTLGHAMLFFVLLLLGAGLIYQGFMRATGSSMRTPTLVALAARGGAA